MEFHALSPDKLSRFIDRIRKLSIDEYESYLQALFLNALTELCEFVSSEGAFVLLDDPVKKLKGKTETRLTYVAAMGKGVAPWIGQSVSANHGLIGETYMLGKSMIRKADPKAKLVIDREASGFEVDNVVSAPLKIEGASIGVLVVYDKKDPLGFSIRDLKLVEIFAGYVSTSVQNAIDAKKSRELSKRDDLTGLFNDRHFHAQLEREVKEALEKKHALNLVFFDLDFFKQVNDRHGHLVGSQTLREIGLLLREVVDVDGATMARYGGDEYVIILPHVPLEKAVEICEKIRATIHSKFYMIQTPERDGSFVSFKGVISASIGVASLHEHVPLEYGITQSKQCLIKLADTAMYKAKAMGKNQVCIADGIF